jgi:alcohol dehydrogenase class IV
MKVRHGIWCVALLMAVVLQANNTLLAQDVAAAARANRATQNKAATATASAKADNEWYSPTRASIHAEGQGVAGTIFYEISGNQDLKIIMDTVEKGKKQAAEIMVINGQCQWMLAKNVPLEKGYEIDALDGAVLSLKLVLELLRSPYSGLGRFGDSENDRESGRWKYRS